MINKFNDKVVLEGGATTSIVPTANEDVTNKLYVDSKAGGSLTFQNSGNISYNAMTNVIQGSYIRYFVYGKMVTVTGAVGLTSSGAGNLTNGGLPIPTMNITAAIGAYPNQVGSFMLNTAGNVSIFSGSPNITLYVNFTYFI